MTLSETIQTPLATEIASEYTFTLDKDKKEWTVEGRVRIDSPENQLKLDEPLKWTASLRGVVSHEPKLRLKEYTEKWGLDKHAKAEQLLELIDHQFRLERQKVIDQIYAVYESRPL